MMIDSSGEVIDKVQEIAEIKASFFDVSFQSFQIEAVKVEIFGERAMVTGRAMLKVHFDEQQISEQYRYTRTFARRRGRWQIIAAQMTYLSTGE